VYYAVANAAAWTLPAELRRWPRLLAGAGFAGCLALAFTLPATSVAAGTGVLGLGVALRALRRRGS
ncbi:MAG TPA: hypothetical protein VGR26_05175, partial [Acidimicrobiales bacterium]|nr:hypothetical protein [Acidimicrobiales bacterium]